MSKKNKPSDNQNIFQDDQRKKIEGLLDLHKKTKNSELEISFKKITYDDYRRLVEHLVDMTDEDKIITQNSLDILVSLENTDSKKAIRVSLIGDEQVNEFINEYSGKKYNQIFNFISKVKPSDSIEIIEKSSDAENRIAIDDFHLFVKLSTENQTSAKVNSGRVYFRYKERVSFLEKDYRIDVTIVRDAQNLQELMDRSPKYEVEMEVSDKVSYEKLVDRLTNLLRIVQDSPEVISESEKEHVVNTYQNLMYLKNIRSLQARQVVSMEPFHVINYLPNKYAVTDKADGERYFLAVFSRNVYFINYNLNVKKTNIVLPVEYNNTIIDGELIDHDGKHIFMAFDVVYHNNIDYVKNKQYDLKHRLKIMTQFIDSAFKSVIPFPDYLDKHKDIENNKIHSFYKKELQRYWKEFRSRLDSTDNIMITRKLYFIPYGIDPSELFMYADLIWTSYVYDELTPYTLDGMIFTPINEGYMIKGGADVDGTPMEYKWKPPHYNSIDYYIEFEKDENSEPQIFFDNSYNVGKNYYVAKLCVGVQNRDIERPVQFRIDNVLQRANIYLTDGVPTDVNGDTIQDMTVVEFSYVNNLQSADNSYNWIALRTRHDKTESVKRYKIRFGNSLFIAKRIWRSIIAPVTEEDIKSLANSDVYEKQLKMLEKINTVSKKETTYYQKSTDTARGMRSFNNYIKKNMINTYCQEGSSVLDIGCGRGGDILKFVDARIGSYVGLDIDYSGLYLISDSANSRYEKLRKSNKNIPKMVFINADARGLFNVKSQESILANMPETNKDMIEQYLNPKQKYDVINCQFTIHYYLSDESAWGNFCKNINNNLADNGHFLVTTFDGDTLKKLLQNKSKLTVGYTDNYGKKNTFFEIVKMYKDDASGVGLAIDLYNSLISEKDKFIREYLVEKEFLIKSMADKCGLELIETDTFKNLFQLYKGYFSNAQGGTKTMKEIKHFYSLLDPENKDKHSVEEIEINSASYKLAALNRYYVFKKKRGLDLATPARVVKLNNDIDVGNILSPQLKMYKMKIDIDKESNNMKELYREVRQICNSVRPNTYLISHDIIDEEIDGDHYRSNKYKVTCLKEGEENYFLLFYRSPERYYYPIYRTNPNEDYLIKSSKIMYDLELMTVLSNSK